MAHRSDMAADQELQQDSEQFDVGRDTGQLMEHDQVSGAVSSLCSEGFRRILEVEDTAASIAATRWELEHMLLLRGSLHWDQVVEELSADRYSCPQESAKVSPARTSSQAPHHHSACP